MSDDQPRLYLARTGTLLAYFTDDGEGGSMLHVEPGWLAREELLAISDYAEVRQAAFDTVARKLGCPPQEVARPLLCRACGPRRCPILPHPADPGSQESPQGLHTLIYAHLLPIHSKTEYNTGLFRLRGH